MMEYLSKELANNSFGISDINYDPYIEHDNYQYMPFIIHTNKYWKIKKFMINNYGNSIPVIAICLSFKDNKFL